MHTDVLKIDIEPERTKNLGKIKKEKGQTKIPTVSMGENTLNLLQFNF